MDSVNQSRGSRESLKTKDEEMIYTMAEEEASIINLYLNSLKEKKDLGSLKYTSGER